MFQYFPYPGNAILKLSLVEGKSVIAWTAIVRVADCQLVIVTNAVSTDTFSISKVRKVQIFNKRAMIMSVRQIKVEILFFGCRYKISTAE